jgi:hypothetical protein
MSSPATTEDKQLKNTLLRSSGDRTRGGIGTHDIREGLDVSAFETALKSGTCFTRTTVGNKELTYVLNVVQQPERSRAYDSRRSDRRPIDPPPAVSLLVYERRNDRQVDITFSYEATFFLFATLEAAPSHGRSIISSLGSNHNVPVLRGCPVSGGGYWDRPAKAIYFIFPDMFAGHEGNYRLCFSLYEMTSNSENGDVAAVEVDIGNRNRQHSRDAAPPRDEFSWRININSAMFTVSRAQEYPGLAESTPLSRVLIEQSVRLKMRRAVRMRRRLSKTEIDFEEIKFEPDFHDTVFGESELEEDDCNSLWNDSAYSSRKDSMSSIGTFRETETPKLPTEELSYHQIPEAFHGHNAKKSVITSPQVQVQETSLMPRDPKLQQHGYVHISASGIEFAIY